jgi:hypothetical protein
LAVTACAHCPAVACVLSTYPMTRRNFAASVEAVYQICGEVEPDVIPVPLAADVSSQHTMLGLLQSSEL